MLGDAMVPSALMWLMLASSAQAAGAVVYWTGRWGWEQDFYTNLANANPPEADSYYWGELYPRVAIGVGLAAVGGARLVGTGAWVIATPQKGGVRVPGETVTLHSAFGGFSPFPRATEFLCDLS